MLLFSWLVEKTLHEQWSDRKASLQNAESVYYTFLASTFVMDSMTHAAPGNFNELNFGTGLSYMVGALPESEQKAWRSKLDDSSAVNLTKVGLELMKAVEAEERKIKRGEEVSRWSFMLLYVAGAVLLLLSDVFKRDSSTTV